MASITEKLALVSPEFLNVGIASSSAFTKMIIDFEMQNSSISSIVKGLAEKTNIIDQLENSSVHKLSKHLESLNLGASASIAKLTENLNLPEFGGMRDSLAELEKHTSSQLANMRHDYFGDSNIFITGANPSAEALIAAPRIPEVDFVPAVQRINSVHSAIAEATRKQNEATREQSEAMKRDFDLLIAQMEVQAQNSEKLVNVSIATAEGNISSTQRNNRQFKIMVFLSVVMALGSIPTIVSGVAQFMSWLHRIQIVHWFYRLR